MSDLKISLRNWLHSLLGDSSDSLYDIMAQLPFQSVGERLWWPYVLFYLLVGGLLFAFRGGEVASKGGFFAFMFPREVYLHGDAIRTVMLVVFNKFIHLVINFGVLIFSISQIALWTEHVLISAFGEIDAVEVSTTAIIGYSLVIFLAQDLGNWTVHFLFHKVPLLWEFHKVHHCPAVLTPITDKQFHPLEIVAKGVGAALFVGPVIGAVNYAFLTGVQEFRIFDVALLTLVFNLFGNFRHSHIWIPFPRWLSYVVSSPAMHQIHHSQAEKHWDRNFAVLLSVWDFLAGAIYIPDTRERIDYGVPDIPADEFDSIAKLYVRPFQRAWQLLARSIRPAKEQGPAEIEAQ